MASVSDGEGLAVTTSRGLRPARRPRRTAAALAAATAMALLFSGCTVVIPGTAKREGAVIDPGKVGGLPVQDGPSGLRPTAPDTTLPVENLDDKSESDRLARNTMADVQEYWAKRFPIDFSGKQFKPVSRLVSYDSTGPGSQLCRSNTKGFANAFFCPSEDLIAWDRGALLPKLKKSFGPMAVVTVLAHEVGHAVAHRTGLTKPGTPTIVGEQQADCLAGAFMKHVAEGQAPHFELSTGDGLNQVLAALFFVRDPVGASFDSKKAHGNAFDRVAAFQFGFSQGPARCARIDPAEVHNRITEFPFKPQDAADEDRGELPINQSSIKAVVDHLKLTFKSTGAPDPTISLTPTSCSGKPTSPVSYCPGNNTVSVELEKLAEIGTAPKRGETSNSIGDFAAWAELASRYVLSVQKAVGLKLDDKNAGLRTACLVGAWAGAALERPMGGRNPIGTLRITAGDLDEAVAELLSGTSLVAADVAGARVRSGFARIEAFRIGFMESSGPCTEDFR